MSWNCSTQAWSHRLHLVGILSITHTNLRATLLRGWSACELNLQRAPSVAVFCEHIQRNQAIWIESGDINLNMLYTPPHPEQSLLASYEHPYCSIPCDLKNVSMLLTLFIGLSFSFKGSGNMNLFIAMITEYWR